MGDAAPVILGSALKCASVGVDTDSAAKMFSSDFHQT